MGYVVSKSAKRAPRHSLSFLQYFRWLLPAQFTQAVAAGEFVDRMGYNAYDIIEKYGMDKVSRD